jgi:hypothetical protein
MTASSLSTTNDDTVESARSIIAGYRPFRRCGNVLIADNWLETFTLPAGHVGGAFELSARHRFRHHGFGGHQYIKEQRAELSSMSGTAIPAFVPGGCFASLAFLKQARTRVACGRRREASALTARGC